MKNKPLTYLLIIAIFLIIHVNSLNDENKEINEKVEKIIGNYELKKRDIFKNKWKNEHKELKDHFKKQRDNLLKYKNMLNNNEITFEEYSNIIDNLQNKVLNSANNLKTKILKDKEKIINDEIFNKNEDIIG
eukprot:TRINITY_DN12902_c0_g1_i1.p1 TRINITY_DN12902_c0_g1~~TRINITY_DN12902_c0_g1_i1.p1  ORF type:complete len:132 (-),score=20.64 TRINITY_DN12902_c0_g1_i1:46-441(-)